MWLAALAQLVQHSYVNAALVGGAIEVSVRVHNQTCAGKRPVRPGEAVQDGLGSAPDRR